MSKQLKQFKREIPELKKIKKCLKEECYDRKQQLKNIKSNMLGSDGLAVRESLIEDIESLKEKITKLEDELNELTQPK